MTKQGTIQVVSRANYCFATDADNQIYFLHFSNISKGRDRVAIGQPVEFDVAPPLPGKVYPLAVNAVVGADSTNGGAR